MMLDVSHPRRAAGRRRTGFTLVEAAMVTVIIGVGVMAMLTLLAAGTAANEDATQLTEAINLANNIHEITMGMPYYDPQTPTVWNAAPWTYGARKVAWFGPVARS